MPIGVWLVWKWHDTFSSPIVANALKPVVLLQADITSNDDNAQAMLKRFGLLVHQVCCF